VKTWEVYEVIYGIEERWESLIESFATEQEAENYVSVNYYKDMVIHEVENT